jgi:twitching motility protein PilT
MSKPVYELPDDGENYPPATSRRAARAAERPTVSPDFASAPPPTAPPAGGFDSYLNAPPPTSKPFPAPSPEAEANYANSSYPEIKFDPTAPATPPNVFDLGAPSSSSKPFSFDDFDSPVSASKPFDLDDLAPPVVSHSAPFDLDDMPPPAAPSASAPFSLDDYAPPTTSAATPAFDPSAFPPPSAGPVPPVFDPAAFAPPTASPSAFDAPPPAFEAPAPAFEAPAPPMPWDSAPAQAEAPPTVAFAFPAVPVPVPTPVPVAEPLPATQALSFDDLAAFAAPVAPPRADPDAVELPNTEVGPTEGDGQEGSDPRIVLALNAVVKANASDLHVTAAAPPMIRVDGGLRPIENAPVWAADDLKEALYSIMSPSQIEIFEEKLELDFAYTLSKTSRFRVNIYQQRHAVGAAFRLIPTEIKSLVDLGIPESVAEFAKLPRGLVLVTGPTGSGKSTTLAALIDLVNRTRADHIMTVEDPIEFIHGNHRSLVNQREVGQDTHSFNNALKHVLRQDPDVILVGELRDLETISVALTAAETGHLVFATLHTQDAPQTVDRMIDVFPPHQQGQVRTQLAATLQGVVCQTLVKKASGKGRVVATEVMLTTPAVANLIREGKTYQIATAMQAGGALGMHTMDQHLAELVNEGIITHRAALEKAKDLDALERLVHRVDMSNGDQDAFLGAGNLYNDAAGGGRH